MMGITSTDISRSNFAQTLSLAQIAAAMFENRLLEIEPRLQVVLEDERAEPGQRLLRAIRLAVTSLDHLGDFAPALGGLSGEGVNYGAGCRDYHRLGATFIARIERSFAPTARDACARWRTVFGLLDEAQHAFTTAV